MFYLKWGLLGLFWILLVAFLHYTLPQIDVVRLTDTYERRVHPGTNALFWSNAATGDDPNADGRDVFFIRSVDKGNEPVIYRNEDTGMGWPPYFKFDTSNVQAVAENIGSTQSAENPQWVAVHHYGWRIELVSIYPNAISVKKVDGPDVRLFPWFNLVLIIFLILIPVLLWAIRARWNRFWRERATRRAEDDWNNGPT